MSTPRSISERITVSAHNIGGIDTTEVDLKPGVNVLTGRNATNRTSFLQAMMAALGSENVSLKGDASEGHVELKYGDNRYTRTLERQNGSVVYSGDPYLEESELADLFAFLLASNEARRAVDRGDDLRELIMEPVDTDEIQAEIELLEAEKREITDRLEELDQIAEKLPELEQQRTSVVSEIESAREELETVEAKIEDQSLDLQEQQNRKDELEETFSALRQARKRVEDIEYDLETVQSSQEELEEEYADLQTELENLEQQDLSATDRLDSQLRELRNQNRALESSLNELQSLIQFNEERLEDPGLEFEERIETETETSSADPTDQLLDDSDTMVCWTCGSKVEPDHIESMLDRLRSLHQSKLEERNEIQEEIEALSTRQEEIREKRQRRDQIEQRIETIEQELEKGTERIDDLEDERAAVQTRIAELEAEVEAFEESDHSDALETHRKANELELRIDRLEAERDELDSRIDERESTLEERGDLEDRYEEIQSQLTDLRTRVDRLEEEAIDAFNDHMDSILEILDYANIDRIWIERRETEVREGRRKVTHTAFDLHVIRETADGTAYRDTIDHLSESEREVTGLVFALAGYLAHEVYEILPFMLLDSLEAIDSDRISALVEYFNEYVDCLVVALLPEDADALSDSHSYITSI